MPFWPVIRVPSMTIAHVPVTILTLLRIAAISGTLSSTNSWSLPPYSLLWSRMWDYKKYLKAMPASWPGLVFDVGTAYVPLQQRFCLPTRRQAVLFANAQSEAGLSKAASQIQEGRGWQRKTVKLQFLSSFERCCAAVHLVCDLPPFGSIKTAWRTFHKDKGYCWITYVGVDTSCF